MTADHTPECDQVSAGDDCTGNCPVINPEPDPATITGVTFDADARVIRRLLDAIYECADNTIADLAEHLDLDTSDEPVMEALFEQVMALVKAAL